MRIFYALLIFMGAAVNASCNTLDEVYAKRISAIQSSIPLSYNAQVKSQIDRFLKNEGNHTSQMLGKAGIYYPYIELRLAAHKLPAELKYLAAASSNLDIFNVDDNGNAGIWNLNFRVAKTYNLKINTYVDERRDFARSTEAAIQYLSDLKAIYNDWLMVIAAWYAGPMELNKAIRMADGKTEYWTVQQYLPENLRIMVPRYIATVYMHHHFVEHRIAKTIPKPLPESDTMTVKNWISFSQICAAVDMRIEDLRLMNPKFRMDVVPYTPNYYIINLPKDKMRRAIALRDSVYNLVPAEKDEEEIEKEFKEVMDSTAKAAAADSTKKAAAEVLTNTRVMYTVRKGENLKMIADWFDCSVYEIKEWNSMRTDKVKSGQRLLIYKPKNKADKYRSINKMSPAQKKRLADGKP